MTHDTRSYFTDRAQSVLRAGSFWEPQVKARSPSDRFLIALHSPELNFQTGPTLSRPEKKAAKLAFQLKYDTFSKSGFSVKHAELRAFPPNFRGMLQSFSAPETCWRRERDSNPRYGFPYSGFQDRLFQPLTHPSAWGESSDSFHCKAFRKKPRKPRLTDEKRGRERSSRPMDRQRF